jgi:hypothetical protein
MNLRVGRRTYSMNRLERLKGVKNAYRKGCITYGEYLGVIAEVIMDYEKEQPLDIEWYNKADYKELLTYVESDVFVS